MVLMMPRILLHSHHHRHEFPVSVNFHATLFLTSFHTRPPLLQIQQPQQTSAPEQQLHEHHRSSSSSSSSDKIKTIRSLLKSCSNRPHLLQIHAHIIRTCLLDDTSVLTSFFSSATVLDIQHSRQFFTQIRAPTLSFYSAIIRAYSKSSSPELAFYFYSLMHKQGISPDPYCSSFLLKSCTRGASLVGGRQIHSCILRDGYRSDCLLLTSLMELYSVCGEGDSARQVFDEMSNRDTIAWNVLISCYTQNCWTRDALCLFEEMQASPDGSEPDDVTCLLLLQACAQLGALDFGKRVHQYIEERGYRNALKLCNSLVAMYSKCGCVDEAFRVFNGMPEKNVVSWSAMISGFAMNGYGRQAVEAFGEMQRMGVAPDDQTLTGVLSACSHGGLIDEGLRFFSMMTKEFGLVPNIHHYGCIVDLLGRAGLLDQAYHLINSMVVEPDSKIWRTLLGACRIHGHVMLGERVVGHLIELKAQQAGDYVLLLNIYASVGDWEKVAVVRMLMKDKGIQTTPGCSTIELKGMVHEFVVDDDSHPMKGEIYAMLDEIGKQLKIAGYVADMTAELHNLDVDGKENALSYHSEKLAIAFGMVVTPPGTTIRVAKNLRICVDCHNFAKVLSSVYNREVVIRDRSRFHHFRQGFCSCNDYW